MRSVGLNEIVDSYSNRYILKRNQYSNFRIALNKMKQGKLHDMSNQELAYNTNSWQFSSDLFLIFCCIYFFDIVFVHLLC